MRTLPDKDGPLVEELEAAYFRLHRVLHVDVYGMLIQWVKWTEKKREDHLRVACRVHAHLALLYKNVPSEDFTVRDVAVFLSSQIFLNTNHRWFKHESAHLEDEGEESLGICAIELYDIFEAKRSRLAKWLREHVKDANVVLEKVEEVVTFRGSIEAVL